MEALQVEGELEGANRQGRQTIFAHLVGDGRNLWDLQGWTGSRHRDTREHGPRLVGDATDDAGGRPLTKHGNGGKGEDNHDTDADARKATKHVDLL
jgi:hypothetical protein